MNTKLIICSCSQTLATQTALEAVESRLASQSFELPGKWAQYLWMAKSRQEHEVVLLLITHSDLSDSLYEIIFKYDTSSLSVVVTLPISDVHKSYIRWMTRYLAN